MATLYTRQSQNIRRTWALMTGFFVLLVALGFVFSQVYGNPNILYVFFAVSIAMNIISYWYSDKIALSVSGAHPADESEYRELHRLVENLAITAGLPKPKVYIINDPAPNAFATGRNKEHAAVAFTTGLLGMLDRTELEGVTAHELSHIGNRDILLSTVVVVLVGLISLAADMFLRSMLWGGGRDSDNDRGNGLIILLGILFAILSPIVATMIQLAISRKREYLADASGALLTRYPEGLASALQKISGYAQQMKKATNATAHLFISNPFGARASRGISKLFMTHPPAEDRIRILREM